MLGDYKNEFAGTRPLFVLDLPYSAPVRVVYSTFHASSKMRPPSNKEQGRFCVSVLQGQMNKIGFFCGGKKKNKKIPPLKVAHVYQVHPAGARSSVRFPKGEKV